MPKWSWVTQARRRRGLNADGSDKRRVAEKPRRGGDASDEETGGSAMSCRPRTGGTANSEGRLKETVRGHTPGDQARVSLHCKLNRAGERVAFAWWLHGPTAGFLARVVLAENTRGAGDNAGQIRRPK